MPYQRQSYLGSSTNHELRLVKRPQLPVRSPTSPCHISTLPDELLSEILEYLPTMRDHTDDDYGDECPAWVDERDGFNDETAEPDERDERENVEDYRRRKEWFPVMLVCQRWQHIHERLLYHSVKVTENRYETKSSGSRLLLTLGERPSLRDCVKDLQVLNSSLSSSPYNIICHRAVKLINICPNIRSLSLHTNWGDQVWPVIRASEKLPRLERISLSGLSDGPDLRMILKHFSRPSLTSVNLSRYGLGNDSSLAAPWSSAKQISEDLDELDLLASQNSVHVTDLSLSDPSAPSEMTKTLMRWPAALRTFSIDFLCHSKYGREYTPGTLQGIMEVHGGTLESINVGPLPHSHFGVPDFSRFPSLRRLRLSIYDLRDISPTEAAGKFSAPSLRHVTATFATENQHSESWTAYGKEEVEWMEGFMACRNPQGHLHSLKTFHIQFSPDFNSLSRAYVEKSTWPWDYLQQTQESFRRWGIEMTYSKPQMSKEDFFREMENDVSDQIVDT